MKYFLWLNINQTTLKLLCIVHWFVLIVSVAASHQNVVVIWCCESQTQTVGVVIVHFVLWFYHLS